MKMESMSCIGVCNVPDSCVEHLALSLAKAPIVSYKLNLVVVIRCVLWVVEKLMHVHKNE